MDAFSIKNFNKREIYFYNMIDRFYRNRTNDEINCMIDIMNGTSDISLRILDWFVTRYSNRKKIMIYSDDNMMDVHISYKAQLKSYKKKYFDPFKRREKFDYVFKNVNKTVRTTIGQLNFFRWALENNIISYVKENFNTVTNEMNTSNKLDKSRKNEKLIKKSNNKQTVNDDIKMNIIKKIDESNIKIILTFD